MEILLVVVAILVLGAGAIASAGGLGGMPTEPVRDAYAPPMPADGPVRGGDLEGVRFQTTPYGYDMAEVDAVLARVARELDERDGGVVAPARGSVADQPPAHAADGGRPAGVDEPDGSGEDLPAERPARRREATPGERANAWKGRGETGGEVDDWRPRAD